MITGDLTLKNKNFKRLLSWALDKRGSSGMKIQCRGHSMAPFINDGDSVTLHCPETGKRIRMGDIVAAAGPGNSTVLIHRVIRTRGSLFQTRGDNTPDADGWFSKTDILGVVAAVEKKSGRDFLNHPLINSTVAVFSRTGLLQNAILPILRFAVNVIKSMGRCRS